MSDLQLYTVVGLPVVAVLTSLSVSMFQISGVRADMHNQIAGLRGDIQDIRADIREIRNDIKLLTGKVYELMGDKH